MTGPFPIVFTDIDGTLIDFDTYATAETLQAVSQLVVRKIPVILCSSKTRREQEHYRKIYGLSDPFIVENGSAIFIPRRYYDFEILVHRQTPEYDVLELGIPASEIQAQLKFVREKTGLYFHTYQDLSLPEISRITGLSLEQADSARQREYSATILTPLSNDARTQLTKTLAGMGLQLLAGGRFHTVTANGSSKGDAVARLTVLFRQKFGDIITLGLGDSANDRALLAAVDHPYLVQKPNGSWEEIPGAEKVPAVGPQGWRIVMEQFLDPSG